MEESPVKFDESDNEDKNKTPSKLILAVQSDSVTPLKELNEINTVKFKDTSPDQKTKQDKTPEKSANSESDQKTDSVDNEDGMLSTVEQARLLIAAHRTPSKTINRTPVKQNHSCRKRSIESSPVTPGKQRRVELITLSSPKTQRVKQS